MRLLYYCPASIGGIADYAHEQAKALGNLGVEVTLLCPPDYPHEALGYSQRRDLMNRPAKSNSRWQNRFLLFRCILANAAILDRQIVGEGFDRVLFATYTEYLAPLWAWRLRRHSRSGVAFGAILHDPVRDYQVGPRWWHRWSIAQGYSFLREAFVHHGIELNTGRRFTGLRITVIPHGPLSFPDPDQSREEFRKVHKIPSGVPLFLCFGHLRDAKNLNLVLEAMKTVPDAWLLVAGSEASPGQRQSGEYQMMADRLAVADRCGWFLRYLNPVDAANCFAASDFVLLTYSSSFRSASGVLNVAAWFRKPVIASCGESNLGRAVDDYLLGERTVPDNAAAISGAMLRFLADPPRPNWTRYLEEHSWRRNAELIKTSLIDL
ncbi:MAG: glycosyltransferase family 4 protein [Verrucomicrobiaceae bacterium]